MTATTWAANLVYYDGVRNVTYSDWRLPFVVDTDGPDADALGGDGCIWAYSGTEAWSWRPRCGSVGVGTPARALRPFRGAGDVSPQLLV